MIDLPERWLRFLPEQFDIKREIELAQIEARLALICGDRQARTEEALYRVAQSLEPVGIETVQGWLAIARGRRVDRELIDEGRAQGIRLMDHSTADWDYENANWSLNTTDYVSSPSSLQWPGGATAGIALCKYAGTTVINEGRVETQSHGLLVVSGDEAITLQNVRNQCAVGSADHNNDYEVELLMQANNNTAYRKFYRVVGGVRTSLDSYGSASSPFHDRNWGNRRITWWEPVLATPTLALRYEHYKTGAWTTFGPTILDTANQWSGSAINRVGLGTVWTDPWGNVVTRFDDTVIYERV